MEKPLLRLQEIIGDKAANPPIPALIPVSRSTWYRGIERGLYPSPVRISERCVGWRSDEIKALIERFTSGDFK